jgi:hypothetical protein
MAEEERKKDFSLAAGMREISPKKLTNETLEHQFYFGRS